MNGALSLEVISASACQCNLYTYLHHDNSWHFNLFRPFLQSDYFLKKRETYGIGVWGCSKPVTSQVTAVEAFQTTKQTSRHTETDFNFVSMYNISRSIAYIPWRWSRLKSRYLLRN